MRRWLPLLVAAAGAIMTGCMTGPASPPTTQPLPETNLATTQPWYWLAKPSVAPVTSSDFTSLWDASERVMHRWGFELDRQDYRHGLLTSLPMVSGQPFEVWRRDAPIGRDMTESALTGIRRTLYFEIVRGEDGLYSVTPKVLVERHVLLEKKLREVVDFAPDYWYPIRRDSDMEKKLAEAVGEELGR